MNPPELSAAVRELAGALMRDAWAMQAVPGLEQKALRVLRSADLLGVLAHLVEGKTAGQAFGTPADWGPETPIGKALAKD